MVTVRKRTLKVLTLLVLFIFLTSFFLNYSHTMVATTWFPKQMVVELSENFKKFMKYAHRPCTCARCIGQQRVSPWFDERFNRSMQPLLTAQNALLEEDTYSWWLVRAGDWVWVRTGRGLGPRGAPPGSHSFTQQLLVGDPRRVDQSRAFCVRFLCLRRRLPQTGWFETADTSRQAQPPSSHDPPLWVSLGLWSLSLCLSL